MNSVVLVGNLCKDVEMLQVGNTQKVDNVVAVLRGRDASGNQVTDFIPVRIWGTQAQFASAYLKKGSKVAVNGTIRVDMWENEDGTKRSSTYVNVINIENLTPRDAQQQPQQNTQRQQPQAPTDININDDDLPF